MKMLATAAMALVLSSGVFAQAKHTANRAPVADRDQLGMTCTQILAMSSSDWVAQFQQNASDASADQDKTARAITVYGKCYDARTDRLAALLGRKGAGPLMGARGNFGEFEQALQRFTAKALATTDPPADGVKMAYAALYEKRFRYELYKGYEERIAKPAVPRKMAVELAKPKSATMTSAKADGAVKQTDAAAKKVDGASDKSAAAPPPPDPMTAAKNRFGELLDALPDEKMHALHAAFGDIVSRREMSEETSLAVYQYAIFLLERANAEPFSPPPF